MMFNSFIFFIFLLAILPVFYFLPNKNSKNIFLLFSSYFFYGYLDWRFCGLLALLTLINYYIGKQLDLVTEKHRTIYFFAGLISNLGILVFFKYVNFFIDSFQVIVHHFGAEIDLLHLNLIIPLGISFYIFQSLAYIIDVYKKRISHTNNLIDFSLFIAFFPKLIAGPIERPGNFLPQISKELKPTGTQIKEGITLIIVGLFRKVMIGDTAGRFADHIFGNLENYKSIEIICALFLFSIQIYADFSGYSHIARGSGKLFGIELMKNFEQPYFSKNITEFWRKWHISLSSWLRDYLFLPLSYSISRKLPQEKYFFIKTEYIIYIYSTMITFTLCGLWHGASWNYVIWGVLHGVFLSFHRAFFVNKKSLIHKSIIFSFKPFKPVVKIISSILFTYMIVLSAWLFFALDSWEETKLFLKKILYWETSEFTLLFITIVISYLFVMILLDLFEYVFSSHTYILKLKSKGAIIGILSGLLVVTFIYMFQAEPSPFIYFQF